MTLFKTLISCYLVSFAMGQEYHEITDQTFVELNKWLIEGGAEMSNIELLESRDNLMRGVFAKEDIKADETILFIPYDRLVVIRDNSETGDGISAEELKILQEDNETSD